MLISSESQSLQEWHFKGEYSLYVVTSCMKTFILQRSVLQQEVLTPLIELFSVKEVHVGTQPLFIESFPLITLLTV